MPKLNNTVNDMTRAIIIATIAGLVADWIRKNYMQGGE